MKTPEIVILSGIPCSGKSTYRYSLEEDAHGTLPGIGRSMDVGVDTNNLYPYHLDEIIDRMRDLRNGMVDHHNELTN